MFCMPHSATKGKLSAFVPADTGHSHQDEEHLRPEESFLVQDCDLVGILAS